MNLAPIYTVAAIRELERLAGTVPLMELAGLAAAEQARTMLADRPPKVIVLAGPGNNGGDAYVVARYLRQWFFEVAVLAAHDPSRLPHQAAQARQAWLSAGGTVLDQLPDKAEWSLVIDGLFGIGLQRPLTTPYLELIEVINRHSIPVLALDIPSGLNADTGQVLGTAIRASHTISFIALKPGLLTHDALDHCGEISVASLGLQATTLAAASGYALDWPSVRTLLPKRKRNSHKGTYGSLGIIGGSEGMVGAALLAGRAALHCGAGKILLGLTAANPPAVDWLHPELMLRSPQAVLHCALTALIVGPGLGDQAMFLENALDLPCPLLIDADGLNNIAAQPRLVQKLQARSQADLLTPHPAEAARLLGVTTAEIQNDRVHAACSLAQRYACAVVLKGAGSICAFPEEVWFINTTGNAGLATAGSGDVLSGMTGAWLAQGLSTRDALLLGTCLHGAAADLLVKQACGPIGMTASELIDAARALIN